MEDGTLEVIGEEEVAAASDVKHRTCKLLELDVYKIRSRIIFHETPCLDLHAEGVHLCQILIIRRLDHIGMRSPAEPGMTSD